ncbi:MAG: FtsQ-type POTRA domain-containing protein [Candidatus Moranbacteria bacterium]|nr:FtsQ-type POTRA domain-containing protein [Candidatus Moranbacteria bacterium]
MAIRYIKNCTGDDCEGERKSSQVISKIIFYLLLVSFVAVFTYMLFFSQYLKVGNIEIVGTLELSSQEMKQGMEDSMQGKYFGIIPKNNFLFFSQKNVEKLLTDNYKKIRTVTVTKKFPDTINIVIDERKALLVWCAREECYLLDEQGFAYSVADFSSPELMQNHLLQINDASGREVSIGSKIIEPAYEQYVLSIKDELAKIGFNVTDQYWTPSRMAEEINVKTDQDLEFYFSTQFELKSALDTLNIILKKEIPKEKEAEIAYIDLRNENKAFYRFKNVEPVSENLEVAGEEVKKEE